MRQRPLTAYDLFAAALFFFSGLLVGGFGVWVYADTRLEKAAAALDSMRTDVEFFRADAGARTERLSAALAAEEQLREKYNNLVDDQRPLAVREKLQRNILRRLGLFVTDDLRVIEGGPPNPKIDVAPIRAAEMTGRE